MSKFISVALALHRYVQDGKENTIPCSTCRREKRAEQDTRDNQGAVGR